MIKLHTIHVANRSAIISSRQRICQVAKDLHFSNINATRIGSAISEICRLLLLNDEDIHVDIDLHEVDRKYGLSFSVLGISDVNDLEFCERFFDIFTRVDTLEGTTDVNAFSFLPSPKVIEDNILIDDIIKKLTLPSKAELFSAIEQQNKTLETQADDLIVAMDEVEKAAEAKSLFLANMSHEIRTCNW